MIYIIKFLILYEAIGFLFLGYINAFPNNPFKVTVDIHFYKDAPLMSKLWLLLVASFLSIPMSIFVAINKRRDGNNDN